MEVDHANQPGLIPNNHPDPNYGQGLIPMDSMESLILSPTTYEPDLYEHSPRSGNYVATTDRYGTSNGILTTSGHRMFGLRPTTFWLLLALIIVIVAAAVGGGIGGSMAVNNARTQCLADAVAQPPPPRRPAPPRAPPLPHPYASAPAPPPPPPQPGARSKAASATPAAPPSTAVSTRPSSRTAVSSCTAALTTCTRGRQICLSVITPTFELCAWRLVLASKTTGGRMRARQRRVGGVAFIPLHVNGDMQGPPADCVLKYYTNVTSTLRPNKEYVVDSAVLQ